MTSVTCTLYIRKLAKTHGKPITLFALIGSNGVAIFRGLSDIGGPHLWH